MPTPSFTITCTRNDVIADGIHELEFTKPDGLTFVAGQFLLIDVPAADNPEDIQPRAYSIASAPEDDTLLLVIKLVEGGRASTWVKDVLQPGVQARIQCPFGKFVLDRETSKDYVFMCTATGIAPFRSHLRTYLAEETTRNIDLFLGLLSEKELFWEEELQAFQKQYPNFHYHVCAMEPEGPDMFKGFVQQQAVSVIDDFSNKQIYLCGSPLMTKAVKEVAISEWGVPKEDVHMEGFI